MTLCPTPHPYSHSPAAFQLFLNLSADRGDNTARIYVQPSVINFGFGFSSRIPQSLFTSGTPFIYLSAAGGGGGVSIQQS